MRESDTYTGSRGNDLNGTYMEQIGQFDLLSAEEEVELAKQIEAGTYASHLLEVDDSQQEYDQDYRDALGMIALEGFEARQSLINANTRLAISIASRYKKSMYHNQFSDLISNANIGLVEAATKFDYKKGFRFSTFASILIKQSVYKESNSSERTIKVSDNYLKKHADISKIRSDYEHIYGEQPTDEYVASQLGDTSASHVQKIDNHMKLVNTSSLDQKIGSADSSDTFTLIDVVSAKPQAENENIFDTPFEEKEVSEKLNDIIDRHINPRDAMILRMHLGYIGDEPMVLQEIADEFDMTRQNVHRIIKKTIKDISSVPGTNSLRIYIN